MSRNNQQNLTIVLILLLFLGLACTGGSPWGVSPPQQTTTQPTSSPTAAAPTPDQESAKLKERLADLEKKLEDQQKPSPTATATPAPPQIVTVQPPPPTIVVRPNAPVIRGSGGSGTAWVNSPGDGFLALRSYPSAQIGYRILKIPHGASVGILGCQSYPERVGGRAGRWCRVSYAGYTGWAFDGWLVY